MLNSKIRSRLILICILMVPLVLLNACGDGDSNQVQNPVIPSVGADDAGMSGSAGHHLWGYWMGYIPETHDSLELIPCRGAMIHVNTRRLLEVSPCTDCLTLENLVFDDIEQAITAEIQLRPPFPGLDKFTGFDVRAVVISDGSLFFPGMDATVPDVDWGDFTLVDPDGYTRLWNTLEFPEGSGPFKILEYSRGNLASPGDFTGTVNPYIEYGQYPRNHFPAGGAMTRELWFKMVPGEIRFGYAIDVSWELPTVDPPVNIQFDFPSSANALEPIGYSYVNSVDCTDVVGSPGLTGMLLLDRQGWETVSTAHIECPEVWVGIIEADSINYTGSTTDGDHLKVEFSFTNELGASAGEYPVLIRVIDTQHDYWLGDVNHMYQLVSISVQEYIEPEFAGEIVFCAPEVDPVFPPPALNVFLLDLETMVETQLTPFIGVGAIFNEPRINPAGTHMLLNFAPTPFAAKISVYEIGGSSWSASPTDVYDGQADFHPDGEHILVASGTQFDDTPDLFSMKYDGTERTKICTAAETVRNPRWNMDGTKIVMTQGMEFWDPPNNSLWIYDIGTETFTEIMAADVVDENPSWGPMTGSGQELIVYASSRDHHPDYETDIFVINPNTQEILFKLDTGEHEDHPSFSPDGLSFVFSMITGEGDTELFVCEWQTGIITQLTDDDTYDGSPSWGWNW